jgi:flagellar protein FlaG
VEINGINNVVAGTGGRVPQISPQPSTPRSAEMVGVPGQSNPDTSEAKATVRSQEPNPGNPGGGAASLEQAVRESVEELNSFIRPYVTSLQFSVDKDLGRVVVKIMDIETKEVIKQIPSEDVLALTKALGKVAGLIVKQEA